MTDNFSQTSTKATSKKATKKAKIFSVIAALLVVSYIAYQKFYASEYNLSGKNNEVANKAQGGLPVETAIVQEKSLAKELSTIGTLRANEAVILKPEISGRIETIHAAEGSMVKKGELIISLDSRIYEAELKQAEAALNLAQTSYNRARLLKEKGAGTVSNFDTMKAALNVAQAQVDLARARLEKTTITAPFDGIIGLRKISPGDYVNAGQELVGFSSNNPIKLDFSLPENYSAALKAGGQIIVTVDAITERKFSGTIYAIDPQIDPSSRNIQMRALLANDDGLLKPGIFARVAVAIAASQTALFIPESALMPRGDENFVMKILPDKKTLSAKVKTGRRIDGEVEIIEGLAAGEMVISAGHMKVRDGQEVTIIANEINKESSAGKSSDIKSSDIKSSAGEKQ